MVHVLLTCLYYRLIVVLLGYLVMNTMEHCEFTYLLVLYFSCFFFSTVMLKGFFCGVLGGGALTKEACQAIF